MVMGVHYTYALCTDSRTIPIDDACNRAYFLVNVRFQAQHSCDGLIPTSVLGKGLASVPDTAGGRGAVSSWGLCAT